MSAFYSEISKKQHSKDKLYYFLTLAPIYLFDIAAQRKHQKRAKVDETPSVLTSLSGVSSLIGLTPI